MLQKGITQLACLKQYQRSRSLAHRDTRGPTKHGRRWAANDDGTSASPDDASYTYDDGPSSTDDDALSAIHDESALDDDAGASNDDEQPISCRLSNDAAALQYDARDD
jgi:hypothetical protein